MLKLAVIGACGRMGQRIVALAHESESLELVAALEQSGHDCLGRDIGTLCGVGEIGLAVESQPTGAPDVMIDFSVPVSTEAWVDYCLTHPAPLVVGTTGLGEPQLDKLRRLAKSAPVLFAPNMSVGVNLLFQLVAQVAERLGSDYDIEISETHHRFKRDAPSGTALELARQAAAGRGLAFPDCLLHGREGKDTLRSEQTIGMHAIRAGDTVGEHQVIFAALGETLELRHSAHTRDTFARGALRAAKWIVEQKPGLYSMADVLGF